MEVKTMNNYSISIVLVFSMIFSLLFFSVKKVEALYGDLNAHYNYTYSTTIVFEGETLSQKIAKAASWELKSSECISAKSNSLFCGLYGSSLYGGYYWPYYGGYYGSSLYGGSLYGGSFYGGLYG